MEKDKIDPMPSPEEMGEQMIKDAEGTTVETAPTPQTEKFQKDASFVVADAEKMPPTAPARANLLGRPALEVAHGNVMRAIRRSALATEAALRPISGAAADEYAHLAYWTGMAMMLNGMGMDDPFDEMPGDPAPAVPDSAGAIDPAAEDPQA